VIPYSVQQTQGVAAVWKPKENPTYGADLAWARSAPYVGFYGMAQKYVGFYGMAQK